MAKNEIKHNPKLEKSRYKKKKDSSKGEIDSYKGHRKYNRSYMLLVIISLGGVIAILLIVFSNQGGTRIEKDDLVKLDYEIYTLTNYETGKEPTFSELDSWVRVVTRYDEKYSSGLIKGFYNKLIGKTVGDILTFNFNKCRDVDKDGFNDDSPGQEALSFGFPGDTLYDTPIVIWFRVIEINKTISTEAQSGSVLIEKYDVWNNAEILNYPLVLNRKERHFFLNLSNPKNLIN